MILPPDPRIPREPWQYPQVWVALAVFVLGVLWNVFR